MQQVTRKAAQLMALLEDDDDDDGGEEGQGSLQLVRLRSANHEVVISVAGGYCMAVVAEAGGAGAGAGAVDSGVGVGGSE